MFDLSPEERRLLALLLLQEMLPKAIPEEIAKMDAAGATGSLTPATDEDAPEYPEPPGGRPSTP